MSHILFATTGLNTRLLPRIHHNTFAQSDENVDWLNGSSRAFEIRMASVTPMTAAIDSNSRIFVDMLYATGVFAATRLLETEPSVYVHLAVSTNVWSDMVSEALLSLRGISGSAVVSGLSAHRTMNVQHGSALRAVHIPFQTCSPHLL